MEEVTKIPLHGSYNTAGKDNAKVETVSNTSYSVTQNAAVYLNTVYKKKINKYCLHFCNTICIFEHGSQSSLI